MSGSEHMVIDPSGPVHGKEEVEAIKRAAETWGQNQGEHSKAFRTALSEFLGVEHMFLVNSGSSANLAALMALTTNYIPEKRRLKRGDEVITAAMGFPTTVSPIVYAGAVPVFVDVENATGNINPRQVEEMITNKTKAIMVAHTLGNPFNLDEIMDVCNRYGLTLIEDNCDSLSSEWRGRKTGSLGHIGTSSFYPAHHISTGEGGAVYTNRHELKRALESIINWGRDCYCGPGQDDSCGVRYGQQHGELPFGYDHKNTYTEFGFNLKMVDLQASIGVEQMKRLSAFTEARKYNHNFLRGLFEGWQLMKHRDYFVIPQPYEGADPSWFGYVVEVKDGAPFSRKEFEQYLDQRGIKSRALFCGNITKQPMLTKGNRFDYRAHPDLSVSDRMMNNAFWIGVHPKIGDEQREYMAQVILNFLDSKG